MTHLKSPTTTTLRTFARTRNAPPTNTLVIFRGVTSQRPRIRTWIKPRSRRSASNSGERAAPISARHALGQLLQQAIQAATGRRVGTWRHPSGPHQGATVQESGLHGIQERQDLAITRGELA